MGLVGSYPIGGDLNRVAQRKSAGPITQRSMDRNHPLLNVCFIPQNKLQFDIRVYLLSKHEDFGWNSVHIWNHGKDPQPVLANNEISIMTWIEPGFGNLSEEHSTTQQSGAAEACWAHNPEVDGSKPSYARCVLYTTN